MHGCHCRREQQHQLIGLRPQIASTTKPNGASAAFVGMPCRCSTCKCMTCMHRSDNVRSRLAATGHGRTAPNCPRTSSAARTSAQEWLNHRACRAFKPLARALPSIPRKSHQSLWRTAMNVETLMLKTIFAAALLICAMTFGAMMSAHAPVPSLVAGHAAVVHDTNSHA